MNPVQHAAFDREIRLGADLLRTGDLERAFRHLERAHVIGPTSVGGPCKAHRLMLKLEIRRRRAGAAFGQLVRLFLGAVGSAVGVVPVGNTGGTDISMFKRLPIAPELQQAIDGTAAPPESHRT